MPFLKVSGIRNTKYKILNTRYCKPRGFTLIELLVVIAIIGILASFAIASFNSAQAKGRDSRRKGDLDAIRKALELYKTDTQGAKYYPNTIGTGGANGPLVTPSVYIKSVPDDPKNPTAGLDYLYTPGEAAAASTCTTFSTCSEYRLRAELENTNDNQYVESQTKCARTGDFAGLTYNTTGTTRTYVVCPP